MKHFLVVTTLLALSACSSINRFPPAYTSMLFDSGFDPIINMSPDYPSDAIYLGMQGDVGIKFVVGGNNRATEIEVIDGLGGPLDSAARRALEEAFFHPKDVGKSGIAIARFSISNPIY